MTIDERLAKFKQFFLKTEGQMTAEESAGIHEYLDPIDIENFECIINTLSDDERGVLELSEEEQDVDYPVADLVHNKVLHRYWDAVSGRTNFDEEKQQLVLSPESSLLELGTSYNVFIKTRSVGLYSIGQLFGSLDIDGLYTEDEMESILLSVSWFREDATSRLEGLDALSSI